MKSMQSLVGSFKVLCLRPYIRLCVNLSCGQLDVRVLTSVFDIAEDNFGKCKVKTEHDTYWKKVNTLLFCLELKWFVYFQAG